MSLLRPFFLLLLSAFISPITQAETNHYEVTPLVGYRFGGEFDLDNEISANLTSKMSEEINYGLLVAWEFDRKRQGEVLLSHYNSQFSSIDSIANKNIAITYAQLGGNVSISDGYIPLYLTGGFGLTHLAPDDSSLDNESRFSMNVGLATKIPLTEQLSFRFGGRVYATFFNSDSDIFCNDETCAISISSDIWVQSEVNAGITFAF